MQLITFTIAGTQYQAEEGMTWEQWCNSAYNTLNFMAFGPNVSDQGGGYYVGFAGISETKTTTIINGRTYILIPNN